MPELPEVETIRRALEPRIVGRSIVDAGAHWSPKFTPAVEARATTIEGTSRRGKYLLVALADGRELVVHLGMTGSLRVGEPSSDPYVRAWWDLDDGSRLEYRDIRRFGRLRVVPAGDHSSVPTLHEQGPDVLDDAFAPDQLWAATRRSNRRIKTQLLSQRPVAGVGNIYADEALWEAQIGPGWRTITRAQAAALHDAIRLVIGRALVNRGTTLRDYRTPDGGGGDNQHHLVCYGRGGEPCLRCGTALRSRVLDARTTTSCPRCQAR